MASGHFLSAQYPSFEAMAVDFLAQCGLHPDTGCLAVAAPVINGTARMTNLSWITEATAVARALGLQTVTLLNDLEAMATAIPSLSGDDLHTLRPGRPAPQGTIAVIAPGTGLGEAFLTWDGARYRAHASEGGHADFAPADDAQIRLLQYLLTRFDHVSFERVCSGIGIPNIYDYLISIGSASDSGEFSAALAQADDRTPLIIDAALQDPLQHPLAVATLEMFLSILGAEAGNLALKVWATGGVYLGGGIAPRMLSALGNGILVRAFQRKGRFTDEMATMPLHVVVKPAAIIGAAIHGLELEATR